MELEHPQESLTDALIDALGCRLPDIEYQYQTPMERREGKPTQTKTRRPEMRDVKIRMFPETWGTTALGFGGMGGSATTPAYTVVVFCRMYAAVYWGGRFAYMGRYNEEFMKDVMKGRTASRLEVDRYKLYFEIDTIDL